MKLLPLIFASGALASKFDETESDYTVSFSFGWFNSKINERLLLDQENEIVTMKPSNPILLLNSNTR